MRVAGVQVRFERLPATSPLIAELVGQVAAKVDPRTRAALLAAKTQQPGGGTSTGANAQRKRNRRTTQAAPTAGGRGGRGGRGKVAAEPVRTDINRAERRAAANDDVARSSRGRGNAASAHRNDVPAARGQGAQGGRSGRPATGQRAAAGNRSASAPRSESATSTRGGGNKAVWSSNTGGNSGGSYGSGSGNSGSGRPARSGPRRASAPASNERRGR